MRGQRFNSKHNVRWFVLGAVVRSAYQILRGTRLIEGIRVAPCRHPFRQAMRLRKPQTVIGGNTAGHRVQHFAVGKRTGGVRCHGVGLRAPTTLLNTSWTYRVEG